MAKEDDTHVGRELTDKQQRFVVEYCIDWNASKAALRAGYSPNGVGQTAFNVLKNTKIQEAIENHKQELAKQCGVDASWMLREMLDVYNADPEDCFETIPFDALV